MTFGAVVEAGDPCRALSELLSATRGREHHRARTVADGRQVVTAEWCSHVLRFEQLVDVEVARDLRVGIRFAVAATARRDLGHVALGDLSGVDQGTRLERREAQRVDAERREVIRVHLHRVDQRGVGRRRTTRTGDHRDVDVTVVETKPRFVHRPRAVHLDV